MNSKVMQFNPQIKTIKWMIEMIDKNPGKLFDDNSDIYNDFWQAYVDLEGIDLPNEMELPFSQEYFLIEKKYNDNYSDWYKQKYGEFCREIKKIREVLKKYINE